MKKAFIPFTLLAALTGCGGESTKSKEPVYPVNGIVTYKGTPVVGADITFANEAGTRGAFGRTNEEGKFKLSTFGANDGAVAGKHIVTISKAKVAAAAPAKVADTFSPNYEPPKPLTEADPAFRAPAQAPGEIPLKFADPKLSGLIVVVNSDAPNEVKFDLTD